MLKCFQLKHKMDLIPHLKKIKVEIAVKLEPRHTRNLIQPGLAQSALLTVGTRARTDDFVSLCDSF